MIHGTVTQLCRRNRTRHRSDNVESARIDMLECCRCGEAHVDACLWAVHLRLKIVKTLTLECVRIAKEWQEDGTGGG